jgi:NADH:ubiquinone oxidoreductase subunit F (NADH-binding)/(2Fe-2S) ferredoxin
MPRLTNDTLKAAHQEHEPAKNWIKVGMSSCGLAAGAEAVYHTLQEQTQKLGLEIEVKKCGCIGCCSIEPLVEVNIEGMESTLYGNVDPDIATWIVDAHIGAHRRVEKYVVPNRDEFVAPEDAVGAAGIETTGDAKQYRIVLRNAGIIDPENIDDYIGAGGYQGLRKALFNMTPDEVIAIMTNSGLRGRGGAGFPTGLKWKITRAVDAEQKYMICNADEGDPGAYMDRSVLEGDPHSVIEGMIIAAYAIGANRGYFYIRAEYPLAIERIENAIKQAKKLGLIGRNVMGSDFDFQLEIRLGAGAFVCGEETALIASIEGKRGTPIPRPPFPSVKGLWDAPTCINNVETLANIAPIIDKGAAWFSSIGIGKSKGTKVFAVTGKVAKSGLVEIPMGTTLNEIVNDISGGTASGLPVKAIQTGGPSGGVIPKEHFDTPVSYEHLSELGSIMGSGGLIVMEEGDSMVDIAKFYLGFCVDESCGKCAPCRHGGKQMLVLLEKISEGRGEPSDLKLLEQISVAMQKASLCGLGQTAPNPVLSTLRYFREEYEQAIKSASSEVAQAEAEA